MTMIQTKIMNRDIRTAFALMDEGVEVLLHIPHKGDKKVKLVTRDQQDGEVAFQWVSDPATKVGFWEGIAMPMTRLTLEGYLKEQEVDYYKSILPTLKG